jgi:hypothetical protein
MNRTNQLVTGSGALLRKPEYTGAPGGRVSILAGHYKQGSVYVQVFYSEQFPSYTVHCTDEQHAMSSHELQSALILTVEFSKMRYTR